ncbi:Predicted enzyme with a TIM-barrel fold [uncultured Clostridium sp.]|nr:Predicted enzyme with a TIM-barrel fold [uncultured Clostridium sp.]
MKNINVWKILCSFKGGINISIAEKNMAILNEIPKDVTLVAVSKTKPIEMIMECYDIGQRDFGENKVQDLIAKKEVLPKDIRWHFIGKLQTNKVKYLVNNVHLIHSLSSIKLLGKIESEFGKNNLSADVLIQINIGREESKSGIYEEELEDMIKAVENCNHVNVKGLMVIIPKGTDEENRYYFNKTKKIFDNLKDRKLKNISMQVLSMGMTNDYKIAIQEGATMIRVGSGIFGLREK